MNRIFKFLQEKKTMLLLIITISLPAIIEMALNTMLGVADTIMISRFIGKEALSSVGFANQIVFGLIFIFSSFNTGAVALISRAFGEKNYSKLKRISEQNINLNLLIGVAILGLSLIFNRDIFKIFDVSREVYFNILSYFKIILVGFVPMFLSFSFAANLRGSGDTLTPMVVTGIANILNIAGNYVLILGIGPFPRLGIEGAAWATSGSRVVSLIIYIYILYIKKSRIQLKVKFFFDKEIIKPLWKISLPGAIEQGLMQISFIVLSIIVSQLDTVSEASFRILIQIESISFMPAVGMSIAAATLVGKSLGEKKIDKASEVGYLSTGLGMLWGAVMGLIFILFPKEILQLFSKDISVVSAGSSAMLFMGINQIALNFVIVISGALRGAGDTGTVMINTVLRLWLVFVPMSFLFIIVLNKGVVGIWYAEICSFILFAFLLFLRFKSKRWAYKVIE